MKELKTILVVVTCLAAFGCERPGATVAQSTLAVAEATEHGVIFAVQLRKGDAVCVTFGDKGTTISHVPAHDEVGKLVLEKANSGLRISGLLSHTNTGASEVKFLENIREEDGSFRVGTYTDWDVHEIPIYVHLKERSP